MLCTVLLGNTTVPATTMTTPVTTVAIDCFVQHRLVWASMMVEEEE